MKTKLHKAVAAGIEGVHAEHVKKRSDKYNRDNYIGLREIVISDEIRQKIMAVTGSDLKTADIAIALIESMVRTEFYYGGFAHCEMRGLLIDVIPDKAIDVARANASHMKLKPQQGPRGESLKSTDESTDDSKWLHILRRNRFSEEKSGVKEGAYESPNNKLPSDWNKFISSVDGHTDLVAEAVAYILTSSDSKRANEIKDRVSMLSDAFRNNEVTVID